MDSVQTLRTWCAFVVDIQRSFDCHGGCPIGSLGSELAEHDETARTAISASLMRWEQALRDGLTRLPDHVETYVLSSPRPGQANVGERLR